RTGGSEQLLQCIGPERTQHQEPLGREHALEFAQRRERLARPMQRHVAPDELDALRRERQPAEVAAHGKFRRAEPALETPRPRQSAESARSTAAATARMRRSVPAVPQTMKPTGAAPGSWHGIVTAQPSRKLISPLFRMMRRFQRK